MKIYIFPTKIIYNFTIFGILLVNQLIIYEIFCNISKS